MSLPKQQQQLKNPPNKPVSAMSHRRLGTAAALVLALLACKGERASAPGGVTPSEAKALDKAAAMLEERRLPPDALPTDAPAEMTGDAAPKRR